MGCVLISIYTLILLGIVWILFILICFRREIRAIIERDPAAKDVLEIVLLYPGLHALILYRITHLLACMKMPFFARALSQVGRFFSGIEIHPGASIGRRLVIDHGMGVVIGETTIIGDNVTLYQGVTLGGTGKETGKRHPTIGNNVVIGAGAKILGNISIGDNSYVGANAVIIRDVPANSTIVGVPGRLTRQDGKKIEEQLDHILVLDPLIQRIQEVEKRINK